MRPVTVIQSALGFTRWVPTDYRLNPANITLDVQLSDGAVLTYDVDYTDSDIFEVFKPPRSLTRAGVVATLVLYEEHLLVPGDWVAVEDAGVPFDGEFEVATVVDPFTITYPVLNTGPLTPERPTIVGVRKANVRVHGGLAAKTATDVSGLVLPTRGVRLNVTAFTNGDAKLTVIQSGW